MNKWTHPKSRKQEVEMLLVLNKTKLFQKQHELDHPVFMRLVEERVKLGIELYELNKKGI